MIALQLILVVGGSAYEEPRHGRLPNLDIRYEAGVKRPGQVLAQGAGMAGVREQAAGRLRDRLPGVRIGVDPLLEGPRWISSRDGYLSGVEGEGRGVTVGMAARVKGEGGERSVRAFLEDHAALFGFDSALLDGAVVLRDYRGGISGVRSMSWQQHWRGIPVFEAVTSAHATGRGELLAIGSQFLPDLEVAAGGRLPGDELPMWRVVQLAGLAVGEEVGEILQLGEESGGAERYCRFVAAPLRGEVDVRLVWLPMSRARMRLCWKVELTRVLGGEKFEVLLDAADGELLIRRCLTLYLSDASYRVFTGDSPSPLTPGHPVPTNLQPPLVSRSLVTLPALNTNASPVGWISDGQNETRGNNVHAHLDRDGDNRPDLPRPQGVPFRVFDFPMDPEQPPGSYSEASVVQLFYWCNWMHDRLYELGFTEEAGNYQKDNFGRGGLGGDPMLVEAQDGAGVNNANFIPSSDGQPGRIQFFVFDGSDPDRDSGMDAEVVIHEYAHGLSWRLVGGGVASSVDHTYGMFEGWSDFFALSLLSEPGDDLDGVYPMGGYISKGRRGQEENYYYGIRRYPYSTDLGRNPLTLKDIDSSQASSHPGVPRNPVLVTEAEEVHAQGEVWCVVLWEARAALVRRYGHAVGNRKILELVTEGMKLLPANANMLQARDAILLMDTVMNEGANREALWGAFARRGMGVSAAMSSLVMCGGLPCPSLGVSEAYDLPNPLTVTAVGPIHASGPSGLELTPSSFTFRLENPRGGSLPWSAFVGVNWLTISQTSGVLEAGQPVEITVTPNAWAGGLIGLFAVPISFRNEDSGAALLREMVMKIALPDWLTEVFDGEGYDLAGRSLLFSPDGSMNFYEVCRTEVDRFPTDPGGGVELLLKDDEYREVVLGSTNEVSIFGVRAGRFYIGSNGDLTLGSGRDGAFLGSVTNDFGGAVREFFSRHRVGGFFADLNPAAGGRVSWRELADRVAVSYEDVPEFPFSGANTFQMELFFDGRIRITHLDVSNRTGFVGLSNNQEPPADRFISLDLSERGSCLPPLGLVVPGRVVEGAGLVPGDLDLGMIQAADRLVDLVSSDPDRVSVPAQVLVPGGVRAVNFGMVIGGNGVVEGPVGVEIFASSPGLNGARVRMEVVDDEPNTVLLVVPASAREGDGILPGAGRVGLGVVSAGPVEVWLLSSDPGEILLPRKVVIPAGQSWAGFDLSVVDDGRIDGPRLVVVEAFVDGWAGDLDGILVDDNEVARLELSVPGLVREGSGVAVGAGSVTIPGVLGTNLTVGLRSDHPALLDVPVGVEIPAGRLSAAFDLVVADDLTIGAGVEVLISVSAGGFDGAALPVGVVDDESPAVADRPQPADGAADVLTSVDLAWLVEWDDPEGNDFEVYFGTRPVPGLEEEVGSGSDLSFELPELIPGTSYFWRVDSVKNGVRVAGPVWSFRTREVSGIRWDAFPDPVVPVAGRFGAGFEVVDRFDERLAGYSGVAELSGWELERGASSIVISELVLTSPSLIEFANVSGRAINVFGWRMYIYDRDSWPEPGQVLTVTADANCPDGGFFQVVEVPAGFKPGFPLLAFPAAVNWSTGLTNNPVAVLLQDGLGNFVDFVCAMDARPGEIMNPIPIHPELWRGPAVSGLTRSGEGLARRGRGDSNSRGDWEVQPVSSRKNNAGFSSLSFGARRLAPVPGVVDVTGGTWWGEVMLEARRGRIYLRAEDEAGYFGETAELTLLVTNDISVSMSVLQPGITTGSTIDYLISVTNTGPGWATNVVVVDALPEGLLPGPVGISSGSCVKSNGVVICELGTLPAGGAVQLTIRGVPTRVGVVTNTVTVWREDPDGLLFNNEGTVVLVVSEPALFLRDLTMTEGSGGLTRVTMEVRLSGPGTEPVLVEYVTEDGSAVGGADYVSVSGLVTIPVGATNAFVALDVIGDSRHELEESFWVRLRNPQNASLGGERGRVTIMSDESVSVVIGDAQVVEGDGVGEGVFAGLRVGLSRQSEERVEVVYTTTNGTATAGVDFVDLSRTLVFEPGETNREVMIPIMGDRVHEADKVFRVELSSPRHALLGDRIGEVTLIDDDFDVLHHFSWDEVNGPLMEGRPDSVRVTARDARGEVVAGFGGAVKLRASSGGEERTVGTAYGEWVGPLGAGYHDQRVQSIYLASEIGRAGRVTGLALDVTRVPGQELGNWTIRMKHTGLAEYRRLFWEGGGWTVVYRESAGLRDSGWALFWFSTPFDYNGVENLMVDFSFDNAAYSGDGRVHYSVHGPGLRSLHFQTDSGFGDPLDWTGLAAPPPGAFEGVPDIRLLLEQPLHLEPAMSGAFVDGVWSGAVLVGGSGDAVTLHALDDSGVGGVSSAFEVRESDRDGDGMPDRWEVLHQFDPDDPLDAIFDPDGDGLTNLQEHGAGTDPWSDLSGLRIVSVRRDGAGLALQFTTVAGRVYRVERTADLAALSWEGVVAGIEGSGGLVEVLIGVEPGGFWIYRVGVLSE